MQEKESDSEMLSGDGILNSDNGAAAKNGDGPGFKVFDRRFWKQDESDESGDAKRQEVPSYVQQLKDQLDEKDRQLKEYIAAYKKEVVEELDQVRERLRRDNEARIKQVRGELAAPMMEVLDAIERSLQATQHSSDVSALAQGVQLVHQLMVQKLREFGLERIETVGRPFDPTVHEAVALEPTSDPTQDNIVVREFSPGFVLDGHVVRAAKVQVSKAS